MTPLHAVNGHHPPSHQGRSAGQNTVKTTLTALRARRVVENDDMPHRRTGGPGPDLRSLHQGDAHSGSRKSQGT